MIGQSNRDTAQYEVGSPPKPKVVVEKIQERQEQAKGDPFIQDTVPAGVELEGWEKISSRPCSKSSTGLVNTWPISKSTS